VSHADALRLEGISKHFGPVRALHDVELSVARGEVHGLVGANGSGKSTLVKILAGYHAPDAGRVAIGGADVPLPISKPGGHGIATIHQDLGLIESLSVMENVVETTDFGASGGRPISWRAQRERVSRLLDRLHIHIDPRAEVGRLTRGQRTLVAIARAIAELEQLAAHDEEGTRHLLIMDEPTAALSASESGEVYALLRNVAGEGGAALFISHHIQEVRGVCHRITVLRDGEVVETVDAETHESKIVRAMLGEELAAATPIEAGDTAPPPAETQDAPIVLRVEDLRTDLLDGLSFEVAAGEVLGVTGLLGTGQDEIPYVIAGAQAMAGGAIEVDGRPVPREDIRAALDAGVVLVPAERRRDGVWVEASSTENLGIVATASFWRGGRYRRGAERASGRALAERFDLRPRDPEAPVATLSGGNQQKVLLAKWLQLEPRVVLLHEPTQGVDIGAKTEIHRIVREFARSHGAAVVVFSSDHVEVAELCDRVIVQSRGAILGTLRRPELSTHRIVELANAVEAT
jgi:ribose transport system ATP-binding protein